MDEPFKTLDSKLDLLDERLDSVDKTLVKQHEQLKYHIQRTNILESKLEPVEKHVAMVSGAIKLLMIVAALVGILAGIRALK
jgi:hypothetical protein